MGEGGSAMYKLQYIARFVAETDEVVSYLHKIHRSSWDVVVPSPTARDIVCANDVGVLSARFFPIVKFNKKHLIIGI